jgi:periplasmic copper chaperone A
MKMNSLIAAAVVCAGASVFQQPVNGAAPGSVTAGSLMIEQVWGPATPPGADTAAAYLTVMNHGNAADTLIGGSMPVAGTVQVHQMSMANGIVTMRQMKDGLPIPAGATVSMDPSQHYHLMLIGVAQPLKQGSSFPLTLSFAKAGKVKVDVVVAALGARAPSGDAKASGMNMPGIHHH